MIAYLRRLLFRCKTFGNYGKLLNRRVEVEQVLLDVANGKHELLTREQCRVLAFKLGVNS